MSNQLDLEVKQGTTLQVSFPIEQSAGVPFNLTGYDVRLQVRRSYGDTSTLINATLSNGKVVLTNAASGLVALHLSPSDTSSIRFASRDDETLDCVYDLELISPTGEVYSPARGTLTLVREVTR